MHPFTHQMVAEQRHRELIQEAVARGLMREARLGASRRHSFWSRLSAWSRRITTTVGDAVVAPATPVVADPCHHTV